MGWTERVLLGRPKVRKYHVMSGIALGKDFGVHNDSYNNVRRGLLERVLYRVENGKSNPTPEPEGEFYERELAGVRDALVAATRVCRRLTRAEFCECYVGRKREVYTRASASLAARPVNVADSFLSTFPKSEKINFSDKPDPAPRVIQPRSPRYNVEVGRSLKRMESALKQGQEELWGGPTIMKGYNARDTGNHMHAMWKEFTKPVALSIDAVRFDQHVSAPALRWEHSVYLRCVPKRDRARLAKLLEMQIVNRGFYRGGDGEIEYKVVGRRMSGDMNTGMGNCQLMCSLFKAFLNSLGIKGRLANNGDDCVLIIEQHHLKRVSAALSPYFLRAGFVLTVEKPVFVFEEIDFCQCHPVQTVEGYVMVRNPCTAIDKDLTSQMDLSNDKTFATWRRSLGHCELALGRGIPVWQEFALMLLREAGEGKMTSEIISSSGMAWMAKGMAARTAPVTDETRVSFWRAFGIPPDMQVLLERTFSTTKLNNSSNDCASSPLHNLTHILG